jgi:ubiquinone/menaquinone biosynthesis C-methylase UbiE
MPSSLYDRLLLPRLIDCACGLRVVDRQRAKVVPRARGRVLEIGLGTGLNLPHYDRSREAGLPVTLMPLSAETLPAPDESFDSIVCTYSLCTIPDPAATEVGGGFGGHASTRGEPS